MAVPNSDGHERVRSSGANQFIHQLVHFGARLRSSDRDGGHDPGRALLAQCLYSRFHGGTRREAVINQDDNLSSDFQMRAAGAIKPFTPSELLVFFGGHALDNALSNSQRMDDISINYLHSAGGNGTHGQLLMAGHAEFSDDEDIERGVEFSGHLNAHSDAAAWKSEDNYFAPIRIMLQIRCQHLAGLGSIVKRIFHGGYRG